MNRITFIMLGIIVAIPTYSISAEPLPPEEHHAVMKRMLPRPKSFQFLQGPEVVLDASLTLRIELAAPDDKAAATASTIFKNDFGFQPKTEVIVRKEVPEKKEAYRLKASGKELVLSAADFAGIRHALSTLRQIAEVNRDGEKLVSYRIPVTEIADEPAMAFRGMHLCWFPETRYSRIEQAVRLAAYYKFNYIVIEFWGTYPSTTHPAFAWKERSAKPEDLRRLVALGKELGVTLIPQYNVFGHASSSRAGSLKHIPLDRHPEYQPIFEPDGWTWCLSNPGTRKVLTDVVLEMYEMFDRPPYFHLGLDEANPPECTRCLRSDYKTLLKDHIVHFHKLFSERNCRIMIWHDMLISPDYARWKGYVAHGSKYTTGFTDQLPKDIVICDWQYDAGKEKDETWPTMRYFKELGFTVLACPWHNTPGMRSLGRTVADAKLDGMLCTTWHHLRGNDMHKIYSMGGQVTWHAPPDYPGVWPNVFGMHLRQIGWDMPVTDYRDTGHVDWQLPPEPSQ